MSDKERIRITWLKKTHAQALVHQLVQLRDETAARQLYLRFHEKIRMIQLSSGRSISSDCPGCRGKLTFENLAFSSVCGHLFLGT